MNRSIIYYWCISLCFVMAIFFNGTIRADDLNKAPAKLQIAVLIKCLAFNKNISGGGDITIYVINAPKIAQNLQTVIGKAVGSSKISHINALDNVPTEKPSPQSVIYLGNQAQLDNLLKFSRTHKILSITGIPDCMTKGITLGIGAYNNKPKIILNLTSTKEEGINWNPAILKVANSIK